MHLLAPCCERIAATTRKTEKVAILADYFAQRAIDEAAISAVFLSGRAFPAYEETTLQVGGTQLWRAVAELSSATEAEMTAAYRRHGDLGSTAQEVLERAKSKEDGRLAPLSVIEVERSFRAIAGARGNTSKYGLLVDLLARATPPEAKYLVKIIVGDLRIGLRESLVEESIAKAYGAEPKHVQRANMLVGDIGETLRLAAAAKLQEARMRLFHPIGFMLASPVETADEAFQYFEHAAVEDKYDGVRAQAHVAADGDARTARLFSRTLDEITGSFPELVPALAAFPEDMILDGEVVAWESGGDGKQAGRAQPFSQLQKRLGRKKVTSAMRREVPVAYVVFDVLYADGELLLEKSLRERAAILDAIFGRARNAVPVAVEDAQGGLQFEPAVEAGKNNSSPAEVIRAPVLRAEGPAELEDLFFRARDRGNEGLMIKDLQSHYTPGRRGKSWLKLKRELATLDVVVTAAEFGHGKRVGVLSDYTFAVRDEAKGGKLVNIGKAYSGLTDAEIAELTQWFLNHTLLDEGFRRQVEPKRVLEVAFNNVMISDRYESGFALRFPRILRIRDDKSPEEADTLERLREIYQKQQLPRPA
ncbi:MAG: ATP-dependent DNA ligase [Acidobacteriales bacterium]|nr:ATP-dependent DNA ligase [Terriglobales bacterium]